MISNEKSLIVLVALSSIVAAIFVLVANHMLGEGLDRVMILLAGMISAAVLSGVSQMLSAHQKLAVNPVTFDANYNRRVMDDIIDVEFRDVDGPTRSASIYGRKKEWEPAARDLLVQDATLALAKLRIDIERELRRIAAATDVPLDLRRSSISRLMTSLTRSEVLGKGLVSTLQNIIPVCNRAVHGEKVDVDLASTILDIGEDVIRVLETYPKPGTASPDRNIS